VSEDRERWRERAREGEEGFVRRWSRRKHEARTGEDDGMPTAAPPAPAEEPPPPERVLTDADMPPIECLTPDSDFSGFMSPGVSDALRQRALQVLFRSPAVNARCPLDSEYYDYANLTPIGSIVTHEMRERMEREAKERLAALGRDATEGEANPGAAGAPPAPEGGADHTTDEQGGTRDA
jgi:hypothetical protein